MQNQKIAEMEKQLAMMQKEIEQMKQNDAKEGESAAHPSRVYDKYKDRLEALRSELFNEYVKILQMEDIQSITSYVSVGKHPGTGKLSMQCSGTYTISSFDELNEEGLSAALDVYTNPRRIAILKELAKRDMTATEISQRTRLQGGQLYHHLSILESANLITKTADKYQADSYVPGMLCGLFAVIGGMDIAQAKVDVDEMSSRL